MGTGVQNVSFSSPQALIAPDLQVQQEQVQRAQALAQALRESSLQDTKVDPGSRVSWSQGLARLADALVSKSQFKKADAQQQTLGQQYAARLMPMFGGNSSGSGSPPAQQVPAAQSAPPQPVQTVDVPSSSVAQGNGDAAPSQTPPASLDDFLNQPSSSAPSQAAPIAAPQQMPQAAPQPMPQQSQAGPMSLTGDPQRDMAMYSMDPQEYMKQVIAAHAPVDMAKTISQARTAMASGDMATASALLANVDRQNYIAPVSARPGGAVLDPHDPSHVLFQSAQAPLGSAVDYSGGQPVGIHQIPGGTQAIAAEAGAKTAGANANEPITGYDAQGNPVFTNKLDAAHGGGGVRPGQAPGFADASSVTGKQSAQAFQTISDGAADVPNRLYALKQMQAIAGDPKTVIGPGSMGAATIAGRFNTFAQSVGLPANLNANTITNAQEFGKWASQYSARSAQELGLSGSDKRVDLAIHATPNGEMTADAVRSIIPQMIGLENAKQGYAVAANQWQQQHGPQTVQQFRTQWNNVYDPRIYTWVSQGPQAFAKQVSQLPKSEVPALRSKYLALKQMGALPQ